MKANFRGTWYLIPALLLVTAALALAVLPGNIEPQTALAHDIPGVNTPVVTARLVETRVTRIEIDLPAAESPVVPAKITETPQEDAVTFYFQAPADPIIETPPAINLIATPDVTYRLEPLNIQPVKVTLVH